MDQSKKTMRHFYCRDVLWETFEQMANDFDCSIDYLVNEAMRYYARSKNYQSPGAPQMTGGSPVANSAATSYPPGKGAGAGGGSARNQGGTQPPAQPSTAGAPRRPAPPTPGYAAGPAAASVARGGAPMTNGPSMNHQPAASTP